MSPRVVRLAQQSRGLSHPRRVSRVLTSEQDLVRRLRAAAVAVHDYGILGGTEGPPPDIAALSFLYQPGEIAAAGGDIRTRLRPGSGFSP